MSVACTGRIHAVCDAALLLLLLAQAPCDYQ
jgi:hypothetical protein